ncbi:MAG: hypothetical protein HGB04_02945 [Chlorobiaceae bacterium]|nr:hypothetical protein [Chlorobiaceae bacterium]
MSGTEQTPEFQALQAPKKTGPKVLATVFIIGMTGFLAALIWINWTKPRQKPEPLTPELTAIIQDMPGTSDAMVYVGLKDIRQSRFWNEALPDSLKRAVPFSTGKRVDELMKRHGIDLSRDLDTLLVSFQRSGRKQQKFIGVAWGDLLSKAPASTLEAASLKTADISGRHAYALDSALWVCPMGPRKLAVASSKEMLEGFFRPEGHMLERDSVSASMLDKAAYKSHLWFTLSSPQWTAGALQSLTSKNRDVRSVGNLSSLQQLAMSVKFDDGLKGQSEWVYRDRRAAFFASSFLWGTITVAGAPGTRTGEAAKNLLKHVRVHQNLESVVITADLPITAFRKQGGKP